MPPILRLPARLLSTRFTSIAPRAFPSTIRTPLQHRYYAQESYGSSDIKENDPAHSDKSSQATHDREHPGPPPPDGSSSSGSSSEASTSSKHSAPTPSNKARPMIHDDTHQPAETEDAKKHNEEFERRYEQASGGLDEKGKKIEK